jgi:hypothetical protein
VFDVEADAVTAARVRRRGRVGRSILRRVMTSTREGSSADAIGAVEPSPRGA